MHTCADATQKTSHQNELNRPSHLAEAQEERADHHQYVAAQEAVLPVYEKEAGMAQVHNAWKKMEVSGSKWEQPVHGRPSSRLLFLQKKKSLPRLAPLSSGRVWGGDGGGEN